MEAINEDITNKGIIKLFKNFSIINKGIIFWIVNKMRSELKFNDSLININQKWNGITPNLIKIEILIKLRNNSIFKILYWKDEIKKREEEKDWIIKYMIIEL